jgi:hypothetical protein
MAGLYNACRVASLATVIIGSRSGIHEYRPILPAKDVMGGVDDGGVSHGGGYQPILVKYVC